MILYMQLEADHRDLEKLAWYVYETDGEPSMDEVEMMYSEPSKFPVCVSGNFIRAEKPIEAPNPLSEHMQLHRYYVGDEE